MTKTLDQTTAKALRDTLSSNLSSAVPQLHILPMMQPGSFFRSCAISSISQGQPANVNFAEHDTPGRELAGRTLWRRIGLQRHGRTASDPPCFQDSHLRHIPPYYHDLTWVLWRQSIQAVQHSFDIVALSWPMLWLYSGQGYAESSCTLQQSCWQSALAQALQRAGDRCGHKPQHVTYCGKHRLSHNQHTLLPPHSTSVVCSRYHNSCQPWPAQ